MTFDVCFVTYNSEKWLRGCVAAFAALNYEKTSVRLYFADNSSSDGTVECLRKLQKEHEGVFGAFEVIETGENLGFGAGSNRAAQAGNGDYVFLCNVDTEIHADALTNLQKAIAEADEGFAAFELRQFPYEHPKFYNPITLEVTYASGACFVLRRDVFEALGGFDESLFMYAEDVDLSWRVRLAGHRIRYVPSAIIQHYAYKTAGEIKPVQSAGSVVGSWVLRAKFGTQQQLNEWDGSFASVKAFFDSMPEIWEHFERMMQKAKEHFEEYRSFYENHVKNSDIKPDFYGFDFCFARSGPFHENTLPTAENAPFFSVIVRTYKRPDILRFCLHSLTHQTYKNFEVVVCEDGEEPISEHVAAEFEGKLRIKYHAMRAASGRCLAANKAIELASGDFLNFLDDDDYFFPEHFEVMAGQIQQNRGIRMFTMGAVAIELDSDVESTLVFEPQAFLNLSHEKISLLDIFTDNQMPIQAVAFHKSLPQELGALDNTFINGYEDWELWARYMTHTKNCVSPKATSCYRVPTNSDFKHKRAISLLENIPLIREKFRTYEISVNAAELFDLRYNESATSNIINSSNELLALRDVYSQIIASSSWRKINWLRRISGAIWRGIWHWSSGMHHLSDKMYGPQKFHDPEQAPATELNSFISLTRKSWAWRFTQWLARKRK